MFRMAVVQKLEKLASLLSTTNRKIFEALEYLWQNLKLANHVASLRKSRVETTSVEAHTIYYFIFGFHTNTHEKMNNMAHA